MKSGEKRSKFKGSRSPGKSWTEVTVMNLLVSYRLGNVEIYI